MNELAWVPQLMEGRLLGVKYTSQDELELKVSGAMAHGINQVVIMYWYGVTGGGGGARINDNSYRGAGGGGGGTAIKWIDVSGVSSVLYLGGGDYSRNGGRGSSGGTSSVHIVLQMVDRRLYRYLIREGPGGNASGGDIDNWGGEMAHGADE